MVSPVDFGGHTSNNQKVKVMMGIIHLLTNVGYAGMLHFALLYFGFFWCDFMVFQLYSDIS